MGGVKTDIPVVGETKTHVISQYAAVVMVTQMSWFYKLPVSFTIKV